ncbi:MAG: type IV toxin-antitoxin system AbiEi family antitoxin domain-containing protein [Patescibacteria group bacterium]|jgi:hypothetical protein|nr:type IV toxin-antitoxin system AbiEi family antitoxin domain-containing protein [Patescibacteria group bacterium]
MTIKPKKGEYLDILLRSPQSIFSVKDVALLWQENQEDKVFLRLAQYARQGKLIRLRRGIYAKDKNYQPLELATRIYTPAYISFETVLTRSGVNFQKYDSIFVASYVNREITVDGQKIIFVRLKDYVLSNTMGISHSQGIAMASKERAFLDRIYVSRDYHFDNLNDLNWEQVWEILPIYNNQTMIQRVKKYFKHYKDSNL